MALLRRGADDALYGSIDDRMAAEEKTPPAWGARSLSLVLLGVAMLVTGCFTMSVGARAGARAAGDAGHAGSAVTRRAKTAASAPAAAPAAAALPPNVAQRRASAEVADAAEVAEVPGMYPCFRLCPRPPFRPATPRRSSLSLSRFPLRAAAAPLASLICLRAAPPRPAPPRAQRWQPGSAAAGSSSKT